MNVARVLRADAEPFERRKIVPWDRLRSDGPARREGIEPGPREVVVWVGTWARFSVLICRDFLDASLRAATERAGVNLLAVPAFSDEMAAHIGHVRAFVTTTQGRVAVVNNPTSHEGNQVLPSAVFGQPVEGRELQELVAPSTSPTGGGLDSLGNVPRWIGKTW
jgi:predicted amidohydrolase